MKIEDYAYCPAIGHLHKPMYVLNRTWRMMGRNAREKWLDELENACHLAINDIESLRREHRASR